MTDPFDNEVRNLIGAERDGAPLPHGWPVILERYDSNNGRRRRPILLAAAAIVAVGLFALVAALVLRGSESEPADRPTATTSTPPTTAAAVDPLAGLNETDWVVPADPPAGYPFLLAAVGRPSENSQAMTFGIAHDPGRVTVQVSGGNPFEGEGEPLLIDGASWQLVSGGTVEGIGDFLTIYRTVNRRTVMISSIGSLDVVKQFATSLVAVPAVDIDFEVLDPGGQYTDVARLDDRTGQLTFSVKGLNGFYCWKIDDQRSGSGASGSCDNTTTPEHPVVVMGALGGPDGGYTVGLAEPNVVAIDFETASGTVVQASPTDESDEFDQLFWILETDAADGLYSAQGVTVHLDDGSTIELEPALGGVWRVRAQE